MESNSESTVSRSMLSRSGDLYCTANMSVSAATVDHVDVCFMHEEKLGHFRRAAQPRSRS